MKYCIIAFVLFVFFGCSNSEEKKLIQDDPQENLSAEPKEEVDTEQEIENTRTVDDWMSYFSSEKFNNTKFKDGIPENSKWSSTYKNVIDGDTSFYLKISIDFESNIANIIQKQECYFERKGAHTEDYNDIERTGSIVGKKLDVEFYRLTLTLDNGDSICIEPRYKDSEIEWHFNTPPFKLFAGYRMADTGLKRFDMVNSIYARDFRDKLVVGESEPEVPKTKKVIMEFNTYKRNPHPLSYTQIKAIVYDDYSITIIEREWLSDFSSFRWENIDNYATCQHEIEKDNSGQFSKLYLLSKESKEENTIKPKNCKIQFEISDYPFKLVRRDNGRFTSEYQGLSTNYRNMIKSKDNYEPIGLVIN